MPEETIGYVRLQWTCRQCGTINPGPEKKCQGCGAAQPEDQAFELPEQQELITSEAELTRAATGPDIHCGFCGARNPSGGKNCVQCGAPLSEGVVRQKGAVLGAAQLDTRPDIVCPFCGAANPAKATKCKNCGGSLAGSRAVQAEPAGASVRLGAGNKGVGATVAIAILLACVVAIGGILFLSQTSEQTGVVQATGWEQSVMIEAWGPVNYEDWRDQVPMGVQLGRCSEKYRYTSSEPVPGARKVCGTAYVKDEGQGYGKLVQDCEYEVYGDWCEYTVNEWHVVRTEKAAGNDIAPYWPQVELGQGEREGAKAGRYQVVFLSNDKTYSYVLDDAETFKRFEPGSKWKLSVNKLGALTSVDQ
mgnify:FL=1